MDLNKGYIIYAQNTASVNYISCATTLAKSLKRVMPNCNVSLLTNEVVNNTIFDHIIKLPYGDLDPFNNWKLLNDWQVYIASPYEYTIKLEADLYIPTNIDYYWDILKQKDLVCCTTIRDFKQNVSNVKSYRKFITDNKLPNTYNAITYFKKSNLSNEFFSIVRNIFEDWNSYKNILVCNNDELVTTDWAYAIASHILGIEHTTMPDFTPFSMIHMKKFINNLYTENWTTNLVYEILPHGLKINTYPQRYPFHYVIKDFCYELDKATT